jgi:phosphoglycerate dehydrogenase-like enzyme
LRENWIAGAALDTHYHYPMPPDHPLWRFPNVILTPHIAGSSLSPRFTRRLWDIFTLNLDRFARGEPLLNELTPAQLAGE